MKKTFFSLIVLIAVQSVHAQKDQQKPKKDTSKMHMQVQPQLIQANFSVNPAPGVVVYEFGKFRGRTASLSKDASGKFVFPFPVKSVSIRVPDNMILYVRTCFEFPSEVAYTGSVDEINLEQLCGIRTDVEAKLRVTFNGISTGIHNNDCLRMAGRIEIKVMENSPGDGIESQMRWTTLYAGSPRVGTDRYTWPIYDANPSQLSDNRYAVELNRGFVYNNSPVPNVTERARYGSHAMQNSTQVFKVGQNALQTGRVKVWVKTDLTSSHKNCDLCDDFSSNVKMLEIAYAFVPFNKSYDGGKIVNAANPYVVLGPYRAHGSRAGFAVTASAGTDKDFRVHLKVNAE